MWHDITALGLHARSNDFGRRMTSPPLDSTHGRTTSGVACHHRLWAAQTIEQRRAWHAINALEQHTRSDDVGRGMTSPHLGSTHGQTISGVTCHHRLWTAHTVERCQEWHAIIAFGQHTQLNDIGMACHQRLRTAHKEGRRRAWLAIISFGQHRRSDDVGRGMPS